ncbi:ribonuclease P protein subunit p40-like isoform X2 [Anthonomus grandis grandis]|uniref:ribonuclease P protein subunit p40-like isoform X2 n=1 Tax=Anthonomus grandis grandis TaxID=2921223 RepID=UPI002165AC54|nr:ribonuclease P protein subunit p40-like isoform X2 [Anthonomus grandis grandis]
MQNPEVWSFHEPQSSLRIQEVKPSSDSLRTLESLYFNHLVTLILPDSLRIPEKLSSLLTDDCEYYKVLKLNLSVLVNPLFINSFVKEGKLSLLSVGTRIDCDNCCAVTPSGQLVLSLTKDTYQRFGLEGKPSHFTSKNRDRFTVNVDLKDSKLVPGKPYHTKVRKALNSLEKFNVIVSWLPPTNSNVCPSSVAKFFDNNKYVIKLCEPMFKSFVAYSLNMPTLEQNVDSSDVIDFIEWMGMVSVEGDLTGESGDYVSSYQTPLPNVPIGQVRVLVWRGFYQADDIRKLVQFMEEMNTIQNKPWLAAYIQGFSDTPVIEKNEEQNFYTNGDNANIFIIQKSKGWICKLRVSAKRYK